MLAGMVQSSSALNPYTNVEGVTERRNTVLDTMITNIPDRADEFRAAKEEPLASSKPPTTCRAAASLQAIADSSVTTH